jgi:putative sigma-54 modulation protein
LHLSSGPIRAGEIGRIPKSQVGRLDLTRYARFSKLEREVRMNITITARHFDLTESVRGDIEKKLSKLQKFSSDMMEAHMIVERKEKRTLTELNVHSKTSDFYAKSQSYDMGLGIDNVIRKMKKQLKTHHEKLTEHKK